MSESKTKVTMIVETDDVRSVTLIDTAKDVRYHEKYAEMFPVEHYLQVKDPPLESLTIAIEYPERREETGSYFTRFHFNLKEDGEEKLYHQTPQVDYVPIMNAYVPFMFLECESCRERIVIMDMKKHNDLHGADWSEINWGSPV